MSVYGRRLGILVLLMAMAAPALAQDTKPFSFRGAGWGQEPGAAKQALKDSTTYKMEVAAAGATRELFTTQFAGSEAALTLEFLDDQLTVITLALTDARPEEKIGAVFNAWAAELTKTYGSPRKGAPTADAAPVLAPEPTASETEAPDATTAESDEAAEPAKADGIDLFGGMPERYWVLPSTQITLLQRTAGTGYDVMIRFQRTSAPNTDGSDTKVRDIVPLDASDDE